VKLSLKSRGYNFRKVELVDMEASAMIKDAVRVMNENNYNVLVLASNERS
jgi:predicted transcriptional regulator